MFIITPFCLYAFVLENTCIFVGICFYAIYPDSVSNTASCWDGMAPITNQKGSVDVYLSVVDFGDEREGVLLGFVDVPDGELHGGLDSLTDTAHRCRLVHGHQHHNRHVLGGPGCVRTVPREVVANLG